MDLNRNTRRHAGTPVLDAPRSPWGTTQPENPQPPYIAVFTKKIAAERNWTLVWIGQSHVDTPPQSIPAVPSPAHIRDDISRDAGIKAIDYVYDSTALKPDATVLEGEGTRIIVFKPDGTVEDFDEFDTQVYENAMCADRHTSREQAILRTSNGFLRFASGDFSGEFTLLVSAEPHQEKVAFPQLEKQYPTYDIMAFYILRCIPQWREQEEAIGRTLTPAVFQRRATHFLEHHPPLCCSYPYT